MRRRCYIHVGTHKTGTTTLQEMLTRNAAAFAAAGVAIVRAGRPVALAGSEFVGNQNLAWQLVSDRRFHADFGTLETLSDELAASPHDVAVVSSEDFILSFDRSQALAQLRDACIVAGYRPTVVVYLREQGSYAQSLYGMFVVRGMLPLDFEAFTSQIFRDATIGWATNRFPFEYERLLEPFEACFGRDAIIARPYRRGRSSAELVRDFLDLLELPEPIEAGMLIQTGRLNEGHTLIGVMQALHRNLSATRAGLPDPLAVAAEYSLPLVALDGPFDAIGPTLAERFRQRFAASNAAVLAKFDVTLEQNFPTNSLDRDIAEAFIGACRHEWASR